MQAKDSIDVQSLRFAGASAGFGSPQLYQRQQGTPAADRRQWGSAQKTVRLTICAQRLSVLCLTPAREPLCDTLFQSHARMMNKLQACRFDLI